MNLNSHAVFAAFVKCNCFPLPPSAFSVLTVILICYRFKTDTGDHFLTFISVTYQFLFSAWSSLACLELHMHDCNNIGRVDEALPFLVSRHFNLKCRMTHSHYLCICYWGGVLDLTFFKIQCDFIADTISKSTLLHILYFHLFDCTVWSNLYAANSLVSLLLAEALSPISPPFWTKNIIRPPLLSPPLENFAHYQA